MYYTSARLEKLESHSAIASCDSYPPHELSNLPRAPQLDVRTLTLNQWSELWSSQLWTQFKQLCMIEACKSQDFNGVWTRDLAIRCDAPTNWAMKPLTLWARHLWVLMSPWVMNEKWYMTCFVFRTADVRSSQLWSSQLCGFIAIQWLRSSVG